MVIFNSYFDIIRGYSPPQPGVLEDAEPRSRAVAFHPSRPAEKPGGTEAERSKMEREHMVGSLGV